MKKIITLCFGLLITLFFSGSVMAQAKAVTKISSVKQKGKNVDFNLSSSKPFIFGSNRYELHVGSQDFVLNTQSADNGKGSMTFFIPSEDFSKLPEGANIYLTYGRVPKNSEQKMDELAKKSNKCWYLGTFSKKMLTK